MWLLTSKRFIVRSYGECRPQRPPFLASLKYSELSLKEMYNTRSNVGCERFADNKGQNKMGVIAITHTWG